MVGRLVFQAFFFQISSRQLNDHNFLSGGKKTKISRASNSVTATTSCSDPDKINVQIWTLFCILLEVAYIPLLCVFVIFLDFLFCQTLSLNPSWPLESVIRPAERATSRVIADHASYDTPLHARTHAYSLSMKPNGNAQKESVHGALMMCFSSPL